MKTYLELPMKLAGFGIGHEITQNDLSDFYDDDGAFGCTDLIRFDPEVSLVICDGKVVSISVADECWVGDFAIMGSAIQSVLSRLGLEVIEKEGSEVEIWTASGGLELYVRDGVVTRVCLSDWSLIKD